MLSNWWASSRDSIFDQYFCWGQRCGHYSISQKQIIWNKQIQSERSISYATSWNTVAMIFCVLNVYLQTIISLAYLLILNAKSWVTEGKISPDCPQYSKTRPISTYLILSANTLCQHNAAWPILFELILYSILDRYNYV